MRAYLEKTRKDSCINRANAEEWTFVLLGRDVAAPATIRGWCSTRVAMGKNEWSDPQILEALATAAKMESEYRMLRDTLAMEVDNARANSR